MTGQVWDSRPVTGQGAVFSHQLFKQLGTNIFGSYTRTEFDDPKRSDNEAMMGAGLTWSPLKWLQFGVITAFPITGARGL